MNINFPPVVNEDDEDMSSDEEAHMMTEMLFNQFQQNQKHIMKYLSDDQSSNISYGGSLVGHNMIYRDTEGASYNMYLNYLCDKLVHDNDTFRRRYRRRRELFL